MWPLDLRCLACVIQSCVINNCLDGYLLNYWLGVSGYNFQNLLYHFVWRPVTFTHSVDPGEEKTHYAAFHLGLHGLQKYSLRCFFKYKGICKILEHKLVISHSLPVWKKENGKIQVLFKVYVQFSSTFQCKFGFQGLFKTALHFQLLFKTVRTLHVFCVLKRTVSLTGFFWVLTTTFWLRNMKTIFSYACSS